ncbi:S8 family peptidase [Anaeromicropila herbilytica]|uniref:Peptidase S8/S53 domain-containing protein n=1 Tax=Anaeromicropila herbilytica TaxID=2785025 RepID=A0A7R7EP82_9FIRM|nr:S8 family peptidase [Anaeromicropila herbilytica]BCN32469.1 hypothetical protein bsdtb5_37640 [Anaeromicropila herbilytica]
MNNECKKRIMSEDFADLMIEKGNDLNKIRDTLDVCYVDMIENTVSVYTPVSQVPPNIMQLYGYSAIPNCYGTLDEGSIEASGISKVQNIPNLSLKGQGVLIGVVDTGINYTLDIFRNADGTTKIFSIWDQSIDSENNMPEGFLYGTEYSRNQINEALKDKSPLTIVPSTDTVGHGTYLAGIAAGNESKENHFVGVVPEAELLIVKLKPAKKNLKKFWVIPDETLCFQKNDLIYGIRYLVETAKKAGRPLSIIIGIGTSEGAHDDKGALSRYLSDIASLSGVAVTIAGGNEGNRNLHYSGTITAPAYNDTFELKVSANNSGFTMEIWGETPSTFSIDILSPYGEFIPRIPARLNETRNITFIFDQTNISLDYIISESQSGVQLLMLRFLMPTEGIWRITVYSNDKLSLLYHAWLPIHQFINEGTGFLKPDQYTTVTSPGNVEVPMVATAYDYSNNSLYTYAGRGYTRNNLIVPTYAAPGVNLVVPTIDNKFKVETGTSLSAAHIAGIAAMFLEWGIIKGKYSQMNTVEIKNFLIRGAVRTQNLTYPNKDWGYGVVDVFNAYNTLRINI